MPQFVNSPFQRPQLLQKGVPAYLIGSFSQQVGNTRAGVTTDAIASDVATVVGVWVEGPLPAVGSLISIVNTTNSAGAFNVQRVPIASASMDADNNLTVTFALTGTNQAATADGGTMIIEPPEVGETVSGSYNSTAAVVQAPEGDSQFTIPMTVQAGASITAMTATLQRAINANTGEWTNTTAVVTKTGATTYTAGPVVEATLERGYAYRIAITAVTGSDKVVGKLG